MSEQILIKGNSRGCNDRYLSQTRKCVWITVQVLEITLQCTRAIQSVKVEIARSRKLEKYIAMNLGNDETQVPAYVHQSNDIRRS